MSHVSRDFSTGNARWPLVQSRYRVCLATQEPGLRGDAAAAPCQPYVIDTTFAEI